MFLSIENIKWYFIVVEQYGLLSITFF